MPKFCANLSCLFTELPFMERFSAAKEAGFDAVEVLSPYDCPAQDMRDQLVWNALAFALMNCPPPNATGGLQGFAAIPGLEDRFRRDFDRTLRFAQVLKPLHIHVMAGAAEGPEAEATFIRNLRWAAERAPTQSLTIEPINRYDKPGYFLADYDTAAHVLDAVAAHNLALQFDSYHAHRITGDVMAAWSVHGHRSAHVQIAGFPGRNEPLSGEIDYAAFFSRLDADGYQGWVSAEYAPAAATDAGLSWMR
ncbi:Putative hydroxypyruvate isomerase YgbM [Defluviimonas aquaemixtae]|uniref:Hydroxypyruvate isomerase YgbM n=1 Tax=Albidovulum aquaemixtae TaxID=1542388 RepID=A0A2R8B272_9RHOB|nr:TIM barrel protein [Defluviimonas aquaemixtae]SPH16673.1 Putative hydroxypyruvate isomerase YgbM [Defluviimonas aquaemixtae]